MSKSKALLLLGSLGLLVPAAACSSKDTPAPVAGGSSTTTKAAASGSSSTEARAGSTEAPGTTKPLGCTTSLKVVNAAAAEVDALKDGKIDVKTAWSDEGPHPDNTVDYDESLDVAISETEIAKDPQFGYGIPVGVPEVEEGKTYLSFSLYLQGGKIGAGQTFVSSTSDAKADGVINSTSLYSGSTRLLPAEMKVTITKLTDDIVCGKVESVTKTDLQSFVGIEGTFELTRIQSLEAAEGD